VFSALMTDNQTQTKKAKNMESTNPNANKLAMIKKRHYDVLCMCVRVVCRLPVTILYVGRATHMKCPNDNVCKVNIS